MTLQSEIEQLSWQFMSIQDYAEETQRGHLKTWVADSHDFSRDYPDHPMNHANRMRRIAASQEIFELARSQAQLFTPDVLDKIHLHMFDCSPVVRQTLTSSLYFVGNQSSLPFVTRLIDLESAQSFEDADSECVKGVADIVIRKLNPGPASSRDTVFVVSPNIQLVEDVGDFCDANGMNLQIGEPHSPDVIAIPYKIGIVDKNWLGEKAWSDWVSFLREAKGEEHDYLVVVTVDPEGGPKVRSEVEEQLAGLSRSVHITAQAEGGVIIEMINQWLGKESAQFRRESSYGWNARIRHRIQDSGNTAFKDRLAELINECPCPDPKGKVDLQPFFKWRMQVKWLLAHYLGEEHLYSKELSTMLGFETDPYFLGTNISAVRGILEALLEDFDRGYVQINRQRLRCRN